MGPRKKSGDDEAWLMEVVGMMMGIRTGERGRAEPRQGRERYWKADPTKKPKKKTKKKNQKQKSFELFEVKDIMAGEITPSFQ